MKQGQFLKFLRKRMKIIFWMTAVVFIGLVIFGWGAGVTGRSSNADISANVAGKIGDYEITYPMYQRAIQAEYEQAYREEKSISEAESEIIADKTWFTLVNRYLANEQFESKGIGELTSTEIFESLRRDPPDAVKNLPAFQQDGMFNKQLFEEYLGNPQVDWLPVEMLIRNKLPYDKLNQIVNASAFVSDAEAMAEFDYRNSQAVASFIAIDPFAIEDVVIDTSGSAVKAYYDEHKEDYRREESAIIDYAKLPSIPSREDSSEVEELAESLIVRIETGDEFEYVAENYSNDPGSKTNGGELGWIRRGQMIPEFEEAAFEADSGDIVGPVLTQFGYHIIHVQNKMTMNDTVGVKVAHILLSIDPSMDTEDSVSSLAADMVSEVEFGEDFFEFAESKGIDSVGRSNPITEDDPIPGIGYMERARTMLLTAMDGSTEAFAVKFSERPLIEGITVVRLVRRLKAGIPPLEEIRDDVLADMIQSVREDAALEIAKRAKSIIDSGEDMASATDMVGGVFDTTGVFGMNSWVQGVGNDPIFIGRTFALKQPGQISAPFIGESGKAFVVRLDKINPPTRTDYVSLETTIKNEMIWQYRQNLYEKWFTNLRESSDIVDNRFADEFAVEEEVEEE